MQKALEYKEWRNFKLVIDKAIISCNNSNFNVFDHFVQSNKMVEIGSGAKKNKYVIEYCSDDRIIAREYELV